KGMPVTGAQTTSAAVAAALMPARIDISPPPLSRIRLAAVGLAGLASGLLIAWATLGGDSTPSGVTGTSRGPAVTTPAEAPRGEPRQAAAPPSAPAAAAAA